MTLECFSARLHLEAFQGKLLWRSMESTQTAQREFQCYNKIFTPNGKCIFFFLVVEGRRRQGKKGSNILVSVQCCCHTRKPNKNNRRKLSVKGNLQTTSKINKLKEEKKKRNFPLCSWPREVPFKGLLILCYSMCSSWFTRP